MLAISYFSKKNIMRYISVICVLALFLFSCNETKNNVDDLPQSVNWNERKATTVNDSLLKNSGSTYLSVYSQIYSLTEHRTHNLTATISMRNVSRTDTIYLKTADLYDTHGDLVKKHIDFPVFLKPLETLEIVIKESDRSGGTGGNFVFDWVTPNNAPEPLFEAIMISTMGQQGLSFSTQGKRIR